MSSSGCDIDIVVMDSGVLCTGSSQSNLSIAMLAGCGATYPGVRGRSLTAIRTCREKLRMRVIQIHIHIHVNMNLNIYVYEFEYIYTCKLIK